MYRRLVIITLLFFVFLISNSKALTFNITQGNCEVDPVSNITYCSSIHTCPIQNISYDCSSYITTNITDKINNISAMCNNQFNNLSSSFSSKADIEFNNISNSLNYIISTCNVPLLSNATLAVNTCWQRYTECDTNYNKAISDILKATTDMSSLRVQAENCNKTTSQLCYDLDAENKDLSSRATWYPIAAIIGTLIAVYVFNKKFPPRDKGTSTREGRPG